MNRTQIYLTDDEVASLSKLARKLKRKQSDLIREAIDGYLANSQKRVHFAKLSKAFGAWKQTDTKLAQQLRASWDRG